MLWNQFWPSSEMHTYGDKMFFKRLCTLRKTRLTVIILALTQKNCLLGKTTGQEPPVSDNNNNNPSFQ